MPAPDRLLPARATPSEGPTSDAHADAPGRLSSPVLVGRDSELARLLATLDSSPAFCVIEGEAGVGKTRLVRELLAAPKLRGHRVLVGRAHEQREPFPLGPLVEALRSVGRLHPSRLNPVAGALRPLVPEIAEHLPPALQPIGDPKAERHRLFRAFAEVLGSLRQVVVAIEDLHWADRGTLDLLGFLTSSMPAGLSLVVTYRREDLSEDSPVLGLVSRPPDGVAHTRIDLRPLDLVGIRALIGAILEVDAVSEEFADLLHRRTSGLPFAVEEVLGLLRDRRELVHRGGEWVRRHVGELEVPGGVRDSVLSRVGRLSADPRRLLEAAAVLASSVPHDVMAAVADLPPERVEPALGILVSGGFLVEESGTYRSRHDLGERVVYEAIEPARRRRMHLGAAGVLELVPDPPVADLARHFREAGLVGEWAAYAERAADAATSLGDDRAASEFLKEVLQAHDLPPDLRPRLATKLGRAALHGLDHMAAVGLIEEILEREPLDALRRGELQQALALCLYQAGDEPRARRHHVLALRDLEASPDLAARSMAALAFPTSVEGDVDEHRQWIERAAAAVEEGRDPAVRASVRADRAFVLLAAGDPEGWEAIAEIPVAAGPPEVERQRVRGWLNVAYTALHLGYPDRAIEFLEEGLKLSRRLSYDRQIGALRALRVLADWTRGRWEGLEGRARRVAEEASEVPHAAVDAKLALGSLLVARGEVGEGSDVLMAVAEESRRAGSWPIFAAASATLAALELPSDPKAARGWIEDPLHILRSKRLWPWTTDLLVPLVRVLIAENDDDAVGEVLEVGATGLRGRDAPAARTALTEARAGWELSRGSPQAAAELLAEAAEHWKALGFPYRAAAAREACGNARCAVGEDGGADLLGSALETFGSLGADRDANRVRRAMRERGLSVPHRRGRRGYGDRLSPREEEVARLAAAGRTNREIADALFVSRKTVESHLGSVMRKCGVSSRDEIAPRLPDP